MPKQAKHSTEAQNSVTGLADEIGMKSGFELLEREVSLNLSRSYALIAAQFEELFGQYGITPVQYNVLRILRGHGTPVSVGQIRDELVIGHPDVPRLVDRLVKLDLVSKRKCDADRRVVWVTITPNGKSLLKKMDAPTDALHRDQLQHMSREQLQQLNELLYLVRHPERD